MVGKSSAVEYNSKSFIPAKHLLINENSEKFDRSHSSLGVVDVDSVCLTKSIPGNRLNSFIVADSNEATDDVSHSCCRQKVLLLKSKHLTIEAFVAVAENARYKFSMLLLS